MSVRIFESNEMLGQAAANDLADDPFSDFKQTGDGFSNIRMCEFSTDFSQRPKSHERNCMEQDHHISYG